MAYKCKLGGSGWDAIAYVRAKIEDTTAPFVIPDASFSTYVEEVAEDFSRWSPLEEKVGDPYAFTSPLTTLKGVQRYVCSSGNGFAVAPMQITDVLYPATGLFNAASEAAYLVLLPFSPINRFMSAPDMLASPSQRILRDSYLNEASHYGRGYAGIVRDRTTGRWAIDLYPTPGTDGQPIFVRYSAAHVSVPVSGDDVFVTVPDDLRFLFAKLLYATVLEQEAERLEKSGTITAGLISSSGGGEGLMTMVQRLKDDVYAALGANVPVVQVGG